MKSTPQQEAVYNAVESRSEHVITEAVAGSGKTTTACGVARVAKGRCGFVAYNKHIATELQTKLAGKAQSSTLHSLGLKTLARQFGSKVDQWKYTDILQAKRPGWFYQNKRGQIRPTEAAQATLELVKMARLTMTDPRVPEATDENPTPADALSEMIDHYGIDMPSGAIGPVREAVIECMDEGRNRTSIIDFTDMIWLPTVAKLPTTRFDLLLVDEVQDFSRLMQRFAYRCGERLVILGDRRQSIYGFTGADPFSMPTMIAGLKDKSTLGGVECPLTVTFRCPVSHVEMAKRLVPQIEAAESARPGTVGYFDGEKLATQVKPGDLVLCRKNAPLVGATFRLLSAGIPAVMVGRDFGKGLADLVERLQPDNIDDFVNKLLQWKARETDKLERKRAAQSSYTTLNDRVACLQELAGEVETVGGLLDSIAALFKDDGDPEKVVRLSSVHRAKGSEADRVFVLEPQCLPMEFPDAKAWEQQQELNIAYVAVTRAKKELWFAGSIPAIFGGNSAILRGTELDLMVV